MTDKIDKEKRKQIRNDIRKKALEEFEIRGVAIFIY